MTAPSIFRLLLALFGLSLCVSISATEICAGVLLLWWFVEMARAGKNIRWRPAPLNKPLLIFFLWGLAGLLALRPEQCWLAVSVSSAFLLFYWASQRLDRADIEWLFKWMCIGGALAGLLGIIQVMSGVHYSSVTHAYQTPEFFRSWPRPLLHLIGERNERAVGPRSHPLTYAECLIPVFFLLLHRFFQIVRARPLEARALIGVAAGFIFTVGGVLASATRGVWTGLIAGAAIYALLRGRRFLMGALAAALVLGALFFSIAPPAVRGRLLSVVSFTAGSQADQESKQTRFELWREAWHQVKERPWTGVGLYGVQLRVKQPFDPEPRIWTETHNIYLQCQLEMGLIGLGLLLWIFFMCVKTFSAAAPGFRPLFFAMLAAFLVAGLTESWTHDKEVTMLFWLMIGCADALRPRDAR